MKNLEKLIKDKTQKEKEEILQMTSVSTPSQERLMASKLLTFRQLQAKGQNKNVFVKIQNWLFEVPVFKIIIATVVIYTLGTFLALKFPFLELFISSFESLAIVLAAIFYLKEIPERRRQFQYNALVTLDNAKGVRDSKARKLALEDLTDEGVVLKNLDLSKTNLDGVELYGVEIPSGVFREANINDAKMCLANLQNSNFVATTATNSSIRCADLSFSNLRKGNFSNSNFAKSNLMFSDFRDANFSGACFIKSKLKGVNFEGAYMSGCDFTGAELIIEDLEKAYLKGSIMPDGRTIHD